MKPSEIIKQEIFDKVKQYYVETEKEKKISNKINYAGRIYDENELIKLVDASLEFWLTSGIYTKQFEQNLSAFLGIKYSLLVNSGSSANLLAFMALTSFSLGDRRIKRGDEVITVAAGFPTTVSPILQYGAVPVFIDVEIPSYNINISEVEKAITEKTKVIMIAHTLGNPFDIEKIKSICDKYNLFLIEDNCDSLGTTYKNKFTGTFGDIGTSSFYPAHHITGGEAGAVYTNNAQLYKIMLSMRDWGRECTCPSGVDNACGKRFEDQFGNLPVGYDHKYVYSEAGFNLKATELQAAILCEQLKKLPKFTSKRYENYFIIFNELLSLVDFIILPKIINDTFISPFGFLITIKQSGIRNKCIQYLESKNIQTRLLFAGNITKQPMMKNYIKNVDFRIHGDLCNTDKVMNDSFWIGVYPGLTLDNLHYMTNTLKEFFINVNK